jgi:hypothetical protein
MKWSVNGFVVEEAKNVIENYARIFMFDYFSDKQNKSCDCQQFNEQIHILKLYTGAINNKI